MEELFAEDAAGASARRDRRIAELEAENALLPRCPRGDRNYLVLTLDAAGAGNSQPNR